MTESFPDISLSGHREDDDMEPQYCQGVLRDVHPYILVVQELTSSAALKSHDQELE